MDKYRGGNRVGFRVFRVGYPKLSGSIITTRSDPKISGTQKIPVPVGFGLTRFYKKNKNESVRSGDCRGRRGRQREMM